MQTKRTATQPDRQSFAIERSATALDDSGTFEALVAVFGNVDKGGDRILPGAFEKSLDRWRATGARSP